MRRSQVHARLSLILTIGSDDEISKNGFVLDGNNYDLVK